MQGMIRSANVLSYILKWLNCSWRVTIYTLSNKSSEI